MSPNSAITQLTPVVRQGPVGRYAPSPTGPLHLGNLRTALLVHDEMQSLGGLLILRLEDLDTPRNVPGSEAQLIDDLRYLGIQWQEGPDLGGPAGPYRQSERLEIYEAALGILAARGLAYPCTCSRKDLREASAPHGLEGPVYPGTCRPAPGEPVRIPAGEFSWRFRTDGMSPVEFNDAVLGPQCMDLGSLTGDFVIRRRDGLFAYQLACAVDDALMGVTHVMRGADLLTSTPRQIALIRALDLPVPQVYAHVGLVADAEGRRLSKREGDAGIQQWRNSGTAGAVAAERLRSLTLLS